MRTLYHYTCQHGLDGITAMSVPAVIPFEKLYPEKAAGLPAGLARISWFTDLDVPDVHALGLTSNTITCDRTVYRFRVLDADPVVPWWKWRRAHPESGRLWRMLEDAPGVMPAHWFVSPATILVDPTPHYRAGAP